MINFFTLILLALLILLKIILVTAIFNNVSFKEDNKNYKTKVLVRDILEAFLLICVIFVLVVKYLEFINVSSKTAYTWGIVSAVVTLVLYVLLNLNFLSKYYKETFQCQSVGELHSDKIDYLTDSEVFSLVPSQTMIQCNNKNIYSHENKYPFSFGDLSNTIGHRNELVDSENQVFNDTENDNMKFLVVDLNKSVKDLKTVI
jgi:hypothetical protein